MGLSVSLLGPPRLRLRDQGVLEPPGRLGELLAILLLSPGSRASRGRVCDSLWPDGDPRRVRQNLNTALWRLRSMIDPDDNGLVCTYPGGQVGIASTTELTCDVFEVKAALRDVQDVPSDQLPDSAFQALRSTVALFRGELLEGVTAEWVQPHRDHCNRLHQECLLRLMKAAQSRGLLGESMQWAHLILEQDPFREDVHRALMETYDRAGQRTLALRQYDQVRSLLATELRAEPSHETEALYYRVIENAGDRPQAPDDTDLGAVVALLSDVQRQLAEGMQLLARHLGATGHRGLTAGSQPEGRREGRGPLA
jgi:DNA-binding SARP family transcriptional activator